MVLRRGRPAALGRLLHVATEILVGQQAGFGLPLQLPSLWFGVQIVPAIEIVHLLAIGQLNSTFFSQLVDVFAQGSAGAEIPRNQFVLPRLCEVIDGQLQKDSANALRLDVPTPSDRSIL